EEQDPIFVEDLVVEEHRYIEFREGRQMETGVFITCVELVEQQIERFQALVDVCRRKIYAVIVIPQRAHRLPNVTPGSLVCGESACQYVRIVLVIPMPSFEKVTWEPITFRRRVTVVHVGGDRGKTKPPVLRSRGQIVEVPHQHRFSIPGHVGGAWHKPVESPHWLQRKVRGHIDLT